MSNSLEPKQKRIAWVDIARGIGMLLVITGHIVPKPIPPLLPLGQWIYSFHIPLFFFISGMLIMRDPRDTPWKPFVIKAAKSLMLPYLLFGMIAYVAWVLALRHFGGNAEHPLPTYYPLIGLLYGTYNSPLEYLDAPIWFLPCLFCTLLLNRSLPRDPAAAAAWVTGLLVAGVALVKLCPWRLPWGLDLAMLSLPFLYVGRLLQPILLTMSPKGRARSLLFIPILLALQTYCAFSNSRVDVARGLIGDPSLYVLGAFAGVMWLILLAPFLPDLGIGHFIGRNTMIIFPMHRFCFSVITALILVRPTLKRYLYLAPLETLGVYLLVTLLGLLVIVPIMKALFPWLVPSGKTRKTS